jgi:uncharacterized membrane protein
VRRRWALPAISFFWLATMWNNHHHILHLARHVDGRVLWVNNVMLFCTTLFPYATKFVSTNFHSLTAQLFYGAVFLAVTFGNLGLYFALAHADPANNPLRYAAIQPRKMAADLAIKGLGILVVVIAYPPAITFSMLVAMLLFVVPERRAEVSPASQLDVQGGMHETHHPANQ